MFHTKNIRITLLFLLLLAPVTEGNATEPFRYILSNPVNLRHLGIPVLKETKDGTVGYAKVTEAEEIEILQHMHNQGRCGGFQLLSENEEPLNSDVNQSISKLDQISLLNQIEEIHTDTNSEIKISAKPEIESALKRIDPERIAHWIRWFSSFHTRYHKEPKANDFVKELRLGILSMAQNSSLKIKVDEIVHKKTPQHSIRVRIEGSERPNEVVVLGGHLDSTNGWGQVGAHAPGADDNASGSSNILEAFLGILQSEIQPKRTIEFFWYAGEEGGLIGSTEIAKEYAKNKIDVVGAMQLDMTLFPGDGVFVMTSVEDFTHPNLRKYLEALNETYTQFKFIPGEKCGYACSDHASWSSQGFAAVYPFESTTESMNHALHTPEDLLTEKSSPLHSSGFAKLALAFVMELSMSDYRPQ